MSLGQEGWAKLLIEDQREVVYQFKVTMADVFPDSKTGSLYDKISPGYFYIRKECFIDSEIHQRIRKRPSGKKYLAVKRIPVHAPIEDYIPSGLVVIEPCTYWELGKNGGRNSNGLTKALLRQIFLRYQDNSSIPKIVGIMN